MHRWRTLRRPNGWATTAPRLPIVVSIFVWGCGGLTALSGDDGAASDKSGNEPVATLRGLTPAETAQAKTLSPLPDLPPDSTNKYADDDRAAALGQRLFFDTSYSGSPPAGFPRGMACATCHRGPGMSDRVPAPDPSAGGGYGGGGVKVRNALGLVNASYYRWVNWGGRFSAQWELPLAVAENGGIMNSDRLRIAHMIFDRYRPDYEAAFGPMDPGLGDIWGRFPPSAKPDPGAPPDLLAAWRRMTAADQVIVNRIFVNYGKSIAAYLRRLVSRQSRFDAFVAGQADALTDREITGLKVFLGKAGCISCHKGPNFTDDEFHNLATPNPSVVDSGRFDDIPPLLQSPFNVDGEYSDDRSTGRLAQLYVPPSDATRGQFRTPTLRNLANTSPYLHTGQYGDLLGAVEFHDHPDTFTTVGTKDHALVSLSGLSIDDKGALVAFLRSLTSTPLPTGLVTDTSRP